MDKLVLKSDRIPFWFELGFFNIFALGILLPLFWFQFIGSSCLGMCCCGGNFETFYRGNGLRLGIMAVSLLGLLAAELVVLRQSLKRGTPTGLKLWLDYPTRALFRSLPVLYILFAVIALPEAQPFYAVCGLLGLWTMFGALGSSLAVCPLDLLTSLSGKPASHHLKSLLIYLFILLAGIPIFLQSRAYACSCGAKNSSVKANMHTFQTMAETYAVDWGGEYAADVKKLKSEAEVPGRAYWKDFTNPYTSVSGEGKSYIQMPNDFKPLIPKLEAETKLYQPYSDHLGIRFYKTDLIKNENPSKAGLVLYDYVSPTRYYIYGLNKYGQFIIDKGQVFVLTNG